MIRAHLAQKSGKALDLPGRYTRDSPVQTSWCDLPEILTDGCGKVAASQWPEPWQRSLSARLREAKVPPLGNLLALRAAITKVGPSFAPALFHCRACPAARWRWRLGVAAPRGRAAAAFNVYLGV